MNVSAAKHTRMHAIPRLLAESHRSYHRLKVTHFCGTVEPHKDGVTRVLGEIHRFALRHDAPMQFVTAVGDAALGKQCIEVPGIGVPAYNGYKLSIALPRTIGKHILQTHCVEGTTCPPSLLHAHSPCTLGLAAQRLARSWNIPLVATYHTHFPSYLKHHGFEALEPALRRYQQYFYNSCHTVLVPSKTLYSELAADGIERLEYLPHGVDAEQFHPRFRSEAWRQAVLGDNTAHGKVVLYVGRLVWEKNLRVFVEAVTHLLESRDDVAVAIVGTGPIESELRRLLPKAHFLGFQTGAALSESYASSDVFFFPSDTETFGNVTIEALASGLPCVVANAGGSADLVQHGINGFALPMNNNDAATISRVHNALATLLDDTAQHQQMAHAALLTAKHYRWDAIVSRLYGIYERVLAEHAVQQQYALKPPSSIHSSRTIVRRIKSPLQTALQSGFTSLRAVLQRS
jgi:glycosyltransferase involved in cell wall biosynthesis